MRTAAVILAAGMGKRMKSQIPKVLHPVLGKSMVQRAGETAEAAGIEHIVVVVGYGRETVIPIIEEKGWSFAVQEEQLGTAHAVSCALPLPVDVDQVVVLLGDVPLLRRETVAELIDAREKTAAPMAVLTTTPPDATGYGRVVMDPQGRIQGIVEEKDATEQEKTLQIINTGIMVFTAETLYNVLPMIKSENAQKEFYLTDAVSMVREKDQGALSVFTEEWEEVAGVNNPIQLSRCTAVMKKRVTHSHLLSGVTIPDPESVWIEDTVIIGRGALIGRNTRLSGETVIGAGAVIGDGSIITGAVIPPGETIAEYSVIGVD